MAVVQFRRDGVEQAGQALARPLTSDDGEEGVRRDDIEGAEMTACVREDRSRWRGCSSVRGATELEDRARRRVRRSNMVHVTDKGHSNDTFRNV